ncbi:N-acetylmuramoyl-L-alanine amidase [Bacillus sp. FJAT-42315]|uniref:N-acetylmuramoyl-L-alanine amidase n=1 Tax=Bacillus sp. FJAT-42315 TaxID=2014077 RepID=UPI001E2F568E|nr:N-acetylmuramoyl-L-alanine amidase [Bacillus sp. FJAT-42315]
MMVHIWLDAGHGGQDAGAIGNGVLEKEIALTLALQTGKHLIDHYICEVSYTRMTDTFVELSDRATMANKAGADFFISFHVNSSTNSSANGFESYRYPGTQGKTLQFQVDVHEAVMSFMKSYGSKDRQMKESNFAVLRETNMPAVLGENLFISNLEEAKLLKNQQFLLGVAQAYAEGIAKGASLERKGQELYEKTVLASPQFQAAQQWVKQQGISDGTYPLRPATREEVWEMIYRANNVMKQK